MKKKTIFFKETSRKSSTRMKRIFFEKRIFFKSPLINQRKIKQNLTNEESTWSKRNWPKKKATDQNQPPFLLSSFLLFLSFLLSFIPPFLHSITYPFSHLLNYLTLNYISHLYLSTFLSYSSSLRRNIFDLPRWATSSGSAFRVRESAGKSPSLYTALC